jgi:glycosyltransferase involved in cell wall biosynthesis
MIGIVVIGRNEGERLVGCFQSILAQFPDRSTLIYVDSGSSDRSVQTVRSMGIQTYRLDDSASLTAAQGRNVGFYRLLEVFPDLEFVQFIDGDCQLIPGWLDKAIASMTQDPSLAIVCGRRRELFPSASIYNQLINMEWNTPVGDASASGGDALVRVEALQSVGGFNKSLICGEEPELCIRLRCKGWKVRRLNVDMTFHDAAMYHFTQWWKRSMRFGWSVAEGKAMHGASSEKYMVRESQSGWFWGFWIPCAAIVPFWPTQGMSLFLLSSYLFLLIRIYRYRRSQYDLPVDAWLYAFFCVLSKFPQMGGQLKYKLTYWQGKQAELIEYKTKSLGYPQS